jgi:RNA ligase (TIGR02306 family)
VPIDSIIYNSTIEKILFPENSKIKLKDRRVRQAKIRGQYSQGLLIKPQTLESVFGPNWWVNIELETDLSKMLEISKYEPPSYKQNLTSQGKKERNRALENPRFHVYGGLIHAKWMPDFFNENDEVVIQEKIHGSNARLSIQPTAVNTTWRKVLNFTGMLPKWELCYGSNRVQLQQRDNFKGYYGEDVWGQAFANVDAFNKVKQGETIYGELVCEGIQANYNYGHKKPHFILFDVKVTDTAGNQSFLNPDEVEEYAKTRGFDFVPVLYKGKFIKAEIEKLVFGPSVYYPQHKVREGIVIKAAKNYNNFGNKRALKWINPAYLEDESNSDEK